MELMQQVEHEVVIVAVSGRLDAASAPEFDQWISGQPRLAKLVIDLARLDYISSAGLRSILAVAKRTKGAGGGVALAGLSGNVEEVFRMSGFLTIILAFDTPGDAVASFN